MKLIDLTNSDKQARIDDEDLDRVSKYKWYVDSQGYARSTVVTKTQMLTERGIITHRVVENVKLHQFVKPNTKGWSFVDYDKLNCQKTNLTEYHNGGIRASKYGKGIYSSGKKFAVYQTRPKRYLGVFDTLEHARAALAEADSKTAFEV